MNWLDEKLLNSAQWFCDRISELTGTVAKFKLQKWMLIFFIIFLWGGWGCIRPIDLFGFFLNVLNTFYVVVNVRRAETEEAEFCASGRIRYHRHSPFFPFFTILLLISSSLLLFFAMKEDGSVPAPGAFFFLTATICFVAWEYFSVCVPKPPCKSEVRQWYEKALKWLRDLRESAPIPAPEPG